MIPPTATPAATPATPAAPPAAAATPPGLALGPAGALPKDWALQIGDEYAPYNDQANTFSSIGGLLKSYQSLRSTQPSYPGADATTDQIASWRTASKVPAAATAEAYGITKPADLPEGVPWDNDYAEAIAAAAHASHAPAGVVQAITKASNEYMLATVDKIRESQAQAQKQAKDELIQAWGADFEARASTARHTIATFAAEAGLDPADPALAAIINSTAGQRLFHAVSSHIGEDRVRTPAGYGDMRSAQQQAEEIMAGSDQHWGAKYRDGDPDAMKHVSALLQQAKGPQAK